MRQIDKGTTAQTLYLFVQDTSSAVGGGLTGLAYNSSGLTCYYVRSLGSSTVVSLATQTVTGSWASSGFVEVDATNQAGIYRLDPPDAALASGADFVTFYLKGATDMMPVVLSIELLDVNVSDRTVTQELGIAIAKLLPWPMTISQDGRKRQRATDDIAIGVGYAAGKLREEIAQEDPD